MLLEEEAAAGEIGVPAKANSPKALASGSLAGVSWYLIDRSCFSKIWARGCSATIAILADHDAVCVVVDVDLAVDGAGAHRIAAVVEAHEVGLD